MMTINIFFRLAMKPPELFFLALSLTTHYIYIYRRGAQFGIGMSKR